MSVPFGGYQCLECGPAISHTESAGSSTYELTGAAADDEKKPFTSHKRTRVVAERLHDIPETLSHRRVPV